MISPRTRSRSTSCSTLGRRVRTVQKIVYCDPRGMRKYADPRLAAARRAADARAQAAPRGAGAVATARAMRPPARTCAVLCTTSGTTSHPKLAMLPPGRFIRHCAQLSAADPKRAGRRVRLGAAAALDHGAGPRPRPGAASPDQGELRRGARDDHGRSPGDRPDLHVPRAARVGADRRRCARPRSWTPRRSSGGMFDLGMRLGLQALERGAPLALADAAAVPRAARPPGLHPAALGRHRRRGAGARHLPLLPGHGRAAAPALRPDRAARRLHASTARRGRFRHRRRAASTTIKIRIDNPDANGVGEIVSRHPNMFAGYYRNEEATRADLRDGWMHTGDAGYFKHGGPTGGDRPHARTSPPPPRGDRFSPQYIENKLKFSPYIAEAVVLGDKRAVSRRDRLHPLLRSSPSGRSSSASPSPPTPTCRRSREVYDLLRRRGRDA